MNNCVINTEIYNTYDKIDLVLAEFIKFKPKYKPDLIILFPRYR
jgi:hypothetical protein